MEYLVTDCPVCGNIDCLEERFTTHNIWGIDVEAEFSYCGYCRSATVDAEQSRRNVERCKAAGCYNSEAYRKYWEGYSSG